MRPLPRILSSPVAIAVLHVVMVFVFAFGYQHYGTFLIQDAAVNRLDSFVEAFYFSAVTVTTLGYGDIAPADQLTRVIAALQALFGMVIIGLFLNAFAQRISERSRAEWDRQLARVRAHAHFELHRLIHDLARHAWDLGPDRLSSLTVWHGDHQLETWSHEDVLARDTPATAPTPPGGDRLGALARELGLIGRDFVSLLDADLRDALTLLCNQVERVRRLESATAPDPDGVHEAFVALRSALLHFNRLLLRRATQVAPPDHGAAPDSDGATR